MNSFVHHMKANSDETPELAREIGRHSPVTFGRLLFDIFDYSAPSGADNLKLQDATSIRSRTWIPPQISPEIPDRVPQTMICSGRSTNPFPVSVHHQRCGSCHRQQEITCSEQATRAVTREVTTSIVVARNRTCSPLGRRVGKAVRRFAPIPGWFETYENGLEPDASLSKVVRTICRIGDQGKLSDGTPWYNVKFRTFLSITHLPLIRVVISHSTVNRQSFTAALIAAECGAQGTC